LTMTESCHDICACIEAASEAPGCKCAQLWDRGVPALAQALFAMSRTLWVVGRTLEIGYHARLAMEEAEQQGPNERDTSDA